MKRLFVIIITLALYVPVFAQKPIQGGMTENTYTSSWLTYTTYPEAYLFALSDENKKYPAECEIAYDSTTKLYSVYVKCNDVVMINSDVRYHSTIPSDDGSYTTYVYRGTDRVTDEGVVITSRTKMSLWTKNYGFKNIQEGNYYEGIILIFPKIYVMLSLTPIVN